MKKPLHVNEKTSILITNLTKSKSIVCMVQSKFTYTHPADVVAHPAREPSPCPPLVGHCVRL